MSGYTSVAPDNKFVPYIQNNAWTISADGQSASIAVPLDVSHYLQSFDGCLYATAWVNYDYGIPSDGIRIQMNTSTLVVTGPENVQKLREKGILFVPQPTSAAAPAKTKELS
jgi:hypothetical protein